MGIGRCTDRKAVLRTRRCRRPPPAARAAESAWRTRLYRRPVTNTDPSRSPPLACPTTGAARAVTNPELAAAAASIAGAPRTIDGVSEEDSVHFQMLPVPKDFYHNPEIVRAFEFMKRAIEAARIIRDQKKMPTKYPLSRMVIVTTAEHAAEDLTSLSGYIKDELNVQEVVVSADEKAYSVNLKLGPNFQKLGKTLGNDMRAVAAALRSASDEDVATYQSTGSLEVCGRVFSGDDLNVFYEADKKTAKPELAMKADGNMMVILDTTQTPEMQDDGVAREVVNRVQRLRKKSELKVRARRTRLSHASVARVRLTQGGALTDLPTRLSCSVPCRHVRLALGFAFSPHTRTSRRPATLPPPPPPARCSPPPSHCRRRTMSRSTLLSPLTTKRHAWARS